MTKEQKLQKIREINALNLPVPEKLQQIKEFLDEQAKLEDTAPIAEITNVLDKLQTDTKFVGVLKGDKGDPGKDGIDGKDGKDGRDGKDGKDGNNGKDGVDGKDGKGKDGKDGKDGQNGKDGSPDTGEQIVQKINELPTDNDDLKIDASHIKGLKETAKTIFTGIKGPEVQIYDLSSQLDGVTKTFSLPAFRLVFDVRSSSFPYAFRPNVDYTTDGAAMTITFTSQIDETATLAAGQTLYILYSTI